MRRARAWCWRPLGCPWSSPRSTSAFFSRVGGTPSPERCTNFSRAPSSPSCARRLSASSFWGRRWRASVRSSSFAASFSQKSALPPRAWSSGSFTDRAEPSGRLPPGPRALGRSWGSSIPRPGISSFRFWCRRSTTPRRSSTSAITSVPVRFRKRLEPDARPLRQDRSPRERLLLRKVRPRVLARVGRARRAVAALMDLSPPTARLLNADGSAEEMPLAAVPVEATFLVPAGQRIPLDGRVLGGSSHVNEAPITGESLPVEKKPGDTLYAGTINGDGALEAACTKAASETTLAHIIRMVSEAQSRRGPSEQWVERFARIYTPAVLVLAILVLLVPPLLLGAPWSDWLYRALVLLVIGCPCALVISTPVSIVAALAAAARNGVLIKGGLYVELPSRLKAVAMDKTGTLTEGRPRVVELVPMSGHDEKEVLSIAAALESRTEHPLAIAIREHAAAKGIAARAPEDFQILQGKGARGRVFDREYWIGSHRFLEERGP